MRPDPIVAARALLALAVGCACQFESGRVEAIGNVDLSWDACAPIVSQRVRDGAHPYSLYASVLGHDSPHKAYQVTMLVEAVNTSGIPTFLHPDAWRFDAPGCQTSALLRIDHQAPSAVVKACPSFQPPLVGSIQDRSFVFDPLLGRCRTFLATTYPAGTSATTNPAQRYFLVRWEFDHTFSVVGPGTPGEPGLPAPDCGGFETNLRFRITSAAWLDLANEERAWSFGPDPLTFCGSCTPVPAAATTWGQIKGQYRR